MKEVEEYSNGEISHIRGSELIPLKWPQRKINTIWFHLHGEYKKKANSETQKNGSFSGAVGVREMGNYWSKGTNFQL